MGQQAPGHIFIVAAPSGGGKTSLIKKLVTTLPDIVVSVSHTTRLPRPGEQEGIDYYFINDTDFLTLINEDAFVEYARVFNHFYGTSMQEINARLKAGIDVVLDIDWQGAEQIKQRYPQALGIFIVPPSLDALKERLLNRRQDNEQVINYRMQQAQDELRHFSDFDYLIVNDDFPKALQELETIVLAHRLKMTRQAMKYEKLLSLLLPS